MLEPGDLVVVVGLVDGEGVGGAIGPLALNLEGHAWGQRAEPKDGQLVEGADLDKPTAAKK